LATSLHAPAAAAPAASAVPRQRGAYAIIRNSEGRVLVVTAANGRCYLPGGRIEPGETPQAALRREIEEECGWRAAVGERILAARQPIMDDRVMLDASYWTARLLAPAAVIAEHGMRWIEAADAAACLHRAGDVAALRATT
jgi:8-oxo-dGTP diphosphatase